MSQNYRTTMSMKTKTHHLGIKRHKVPVEGAFCLYTHRVCMQKKLDGFEYCIKHILEDKNSPYKQCTFISNKNGKRCHNAALKSDKKDGQCTEHAKRMVTARMKSNQKKKPKETVETLLEEIEHYSSGHDLPSTSDGRRARPSTDSVTSRILDYGSSSESESEMPLVDQAWRGDVESDAESIDSEQEDVLKHASVYTAEEVALITRDKLIRLQSLYIDQFKRLQHVLKERRRRYLHARRIEKDTLGCIEASKDDPEQKGHYSKLMAMKRYHKRHGKEALLHRQSKERRIAMSEGASYRPPSFTKCVQVYRGAKCGQKVVPLSKFCSDHVLEDQHQVLFQTCGFGEGSCKQPVPAFDDEMRCCAHVALAEYQNRLAVKEEVKLEPSYTSTEHVSSGENATTLTTDINMSTEALNVSGDSSAEPMHIDVEGDGSLKPDDNPRDSLLSIDKDVNNDPSQTATSCTEQTGVTNLGESAS